MEPTTVIVSILPFEIKDQKAGLYPGNFIIPAGSLVSPGILQVKNSVFYIPMAYGADSLQATSSAWEVANSIVNDYVGALLGVNEECKPGIFVVPTEVGEVKSPSEAVTKLFDKLQECETAQHKWFARLVALADHEYSQHHKADAISTLQKVAARGLNLKDRPWLVDLDQMSLMNCPACFSPMNKKAVVCPACRTVVDMVRYREMQFQSVEMAAPSSVDLIT